MMKRTAVAVASCLALAACGGGASGGNAAGGKTFTYGTSVAANSKQSSALDVQVSGALALKSAPDASSAQDVASASDITNALLGDTTVNLATASPAQQRLLAVGARAVARQLASGGSVVTSTGGDAFDNPACAATTTTSVTMKGCTITVTSTGTTSKVQVDGAVSFDPAKATLTWELTVTDTVSAPAQSVSGSARVHESGTLTVTDTTIKGQFLAELGASASSPSGSASLAFSEAVSIDVTYAGDPACVTGGTLEAKRVWTDRGGVSAAELPDKAAKVTWTACGVGTIAFSQ
ncbi:MAG TPA: hypothetical protein VF400_13615 [Anaeromyxobacteraceae bacterium]